MGSIAVPGHEPVNGEGVAQVMEACAGALVLSDGALVQQAVEGLIDRSVVQAAATLVEEQWRVQRAGFYLEAAFDVVFKRLATASAQGEPAGLVKLALGNVKPLFGD